MRSKTTISTGFLIIIFLTKLSGSFGQSIHPLEPISKHYKALAAISPSPDPQRSWIDTIIFPWPEYSKNAITNSLVRTLYLSKEDEAKLPGLIRSPANSSNETRAELDYLLSLQNIRDKRTNRQGGIHC